jgi:hypothetical protein
MGGGVEAERPARSEPEAEEQRLQRVPAHSLSPLRALLLERLATRGAGA